MLALMTEKALTLLGLRETSELPSRIVPWSAEAHTEFLHVAILSHAATGDPAEGLVIDCDPD